MSATLGEQIEDLKTKYGSLNTRMKRLVISGILALVYAVLDVILIQPLMEEYSEVTKAVEKAKAESKAYGLQLLQLQNQLGIDPTLSEAEQVEELNRRLEELDNSISRATSSFIKPREMARFIEVLFSNMKGVELVEVEKQEYEIIKIETVEPSPAAAADVKKTGKEKGKTEVTQTKIAETIAPSGDELFYQHGVVVTIRGKYPDLVRALQQIESMPFKVFWKSAMLRTETYPYSSLSIYIYTLSTDKDWLTL